MSAATERLISQVDSHRRALDHLAMCERERDVAIRDAAHKGMSLRQIAEVAGLSHQRVAQIVNAP